jgi:putative heme iron utilization protein
MSTGGHRLSAEVLEEFKDEFASVPPPAPEPTHAERARTLVHYQTTGSLATMAADEAGYPFGSVVTYALDGQGRPLLCLSDIAEHTRNMKRDAKASLLVTEPPEAESDRLALGRVTLVGEVTPVAEADVAASNELFRAAHPNAYYSDFDDFHFYRMDIRTVRYVGGFGHMSWVTFDDYAAATPDPLKPSAAGIIDHMNNDHADALVAYCKALAGEPNTTSAQMLTVDRYGFDVLAISEAGRRAVRIPFGELCDDTTAVRMATIRLLGEARELLS